MYQLSPMLLIATIESQLQMLRQMLPRNPVMAGPNMFNTEMPEDDGSRNFGNYQFHSSMNHGTYNSMPRSADGGQFHSNPNFARLVDPQNPTHAMAILDGLLHNQGMPTLTQLNALAQTGVITYDPTSVGGPLSVMGFTQALVFSCTAPDWYEQLKQYCDDNHLKQYIKSVMILEYNAQKEKVLVVCNPDTKYVKTASFRTHQILESVGLVPVDSDEPL